MSLGGEGVTPASSELSIESAVPCPVSGCGEVLQSSAHLRMHTERRHNGGKLEPGRPNKEFYCPFEGCGRGEGGGKPFPRLGQLKQHYQTMHSGKSFTCKKCAKEFGLRDVCQRHEAECGEVFACATCRATFRSSNALYKHAKRKQHTLPEARRKPKQVPNNEPPPLPRIIVLPPPVIKQVVRLAKQVTTGSQTEHSSASSPAMMDATSQTDPVQLPPQTTDLVDHCQAAGLTCNEVEQSYQPSQAGCSLFHPCLSATQTDLRLTDLSTQTDRTYLATKLLNFGTQTPGATATQGCQTQLEQGSIETIGLDYDSEPADFSTQLGALDYSTQTACGLDSATQTMAFDSSDLSFVEQALSSTVLPPDCMDFGTQTLTALPCLDFGTQTLLLSDTKDQGSQT